jgi:2Fe-2S ferredoxin
VVTVRVEPDGIELDVALGETVMAAAVRSGWVWPTVCGGLAECGVCVLKVLASGALPSPAPLEQGRLDALPLARRAEWRLACQLRPETEGLVVRKRGVRRGT